MNKEGRIKIRFLRDSESWNGVDSIIREKDVVKLVRERYQRWKKTMTKNDWQLLEEAKRILGVGRDDE